MARKRKASVEAPKVITVDEVLDLVGDSDAEQGIFIGRNKAGNVLLFSTHPSVSFYHHLLNTAIFQLNVIENNQLRAVAEQEAVDSAE